MDEIDLEALNGEHLLGKVETDFACVQLYRGRLELIDDEGHGRVHPGEGLIVEVYDRASTSIWWEITDEEKRALRDLFT